MSFGGIMDWIMSNLEWSLLSRALAVLLVTTALEAIFAKALNLLRERRQQIWFFICTAVVLSFVMWSLPDRYPKPAFRTEVPYASMMMPQVGIVSPTAFLEIEIINDGYAQSSVGYFNVNTEIDGRRYAAGLTEAPPILFISSQNGINIFCGRDSIFNKILNPIPPGGTVTGIALFRFPEGTQNVLNRPLTLHLVYGDAYGGKYDTPIDIGGTGHTATIGLPGVAMSTVQPPALGKEGQSPNTQAVQMPFVNPCGIVPIGPPAALPPSPAPQGTPGKS